MKTNLILAIRNIFNNLTNSLISVIGLSLAFTCCLIIYLFVIQQHNYDNFHEKGERIYRLNYELNYEAFTNNDVRLEPEIADLLKEKIPQIEKSTEYRFAFTQSLTFNKTYYDTEMSYADKDFFDIFSFNLLAGNKDELFKGPYEIVITREFADRIIANDSLNYQSLIGQSLEFPLAYNHPFTITGILEDIPHNSCINFEGIIPGENGQSFGGCDNAIGYTSVFYLLKNGADPKQTGNDVNNVLKDYYASRIQRMQNQNVLVKTDKAFIPYVLPLKDIYLHDEIGNCYQSSFDSKNLTILITIGILILIIACSNYTILTLGQYLKKIGEVGIRKTMGALKRNIFSIFLAEGIVLTLASFIMASLLTLVLIPLFNNLSDSNIFIELIDLKQLFVFILGSFFSVVVLTSIIPVLVFSNIRPNQIASNKIKIGNKGIISQIFISFQYSISIILIIVAIFIVKQANYLKNRSLGITTSNIIDIDISRLSGNEKNLFCNLLKEEPGILNFTKSSRNFLNGSSDNFIDKGDGEQIDVFRFKVDENYIATLDLQLIRGENFDINNVRSGDRTMIVNEKFTEMFMIQDNPIGKTYRVNNVNFTIKGVVKDYNFRTMKREIRPALLFTRTNYGNGYNNVLLKFNPEKTAEVIKYIEKSYHSTAPGKILEYNFWDEKLKERYEEEEIWSKIIGYAALIAIIISSMGLFGLTILLINQRIKEIGVRKVNGARSTDVMFHINKSFILWLSISVIIAAPLAYKIVYIWLNDFAYRINISWWIFAVAGIVAMAVAALTVSWKSMQAARKNPVEALRYE